MEGRQYIMYQDYTAYGGRPANARPLIDTANLMRKLQQEFNERARLQYMEAQKKKKQQLEAQGHADIRGFADQNLQNNFMNMGATEDFGGQVRGSGIDNSMQTPYGGGGGFSNYMNWKHGGY